MKQAAVIRQNNGMNRHDALVTAHRIGALIRQMHHGNVCFRYTKQDGTIRHATGTLTGYEHSFHRRIYPNRKIRSLSTMISKPKAGAPFTLKNFSGYRNGRARQQQVKMNLQKNGMNGQERKEWEALCRQYNVDSLYEAIQGCREELEFLIHCAERLEPHTEEEEETPFNTYRPQRFSAPESAV